jgi:hypothetical protein
MRGTSDAVPNLLWASCGADQACGGTFARNPDGKQRSPTNPFVKRSARPSFWPWSQPKSGENRLPTAEKRGRRHEIPTETNRAGRKKLHVRCADGVQMSRGLRDGRRDVGEAAPKDLDATWIPVIILSNLAVWWPRPGPPDKFSQGGLNQLQIAQTSAKQEQQEQTGSDVGIL